MESGLFFFMAHRTSHLSLLPLVNIRIYPPFSLSCLWRMCQGRRPCLQSCHVSDIWKWKTELGLSKALKNNNNNSCHNNSADPYNGPKAWLCVRLTLGSCSKRQSWNPIHPHPVLRAFRSMTLEKVMEMPEFWKKWIRFAKKFLHTLESEHFFFFFFTCARKSKCANQKVETLLPNKLWRSKYVTTSFSFPLHVRLRGC